MEKIISFIILLCILILNTSCSLSSEAINNENEELLPILEDISVSEFLLINDQKLYYCINDTDSEMTDLVDKSIFEYDIKSGNNIKLDTFENISISSKSVAINQKDLYMHMATDEQNSIVKLDTVKYTADIIKKWNTFPPLAYLYMIKDELIVFGPDSNKSGYNYYINRHSLNNNKEENIVTKKIENQIGELIVSIDVDKDFIYAFSILADGKSESSHIIKYDIDGIQKDIYPLDLSSYQSENTLDIDDDIIMKIYKEQNYIIINTINGRVFIFKIIDNTLKPFDIPDRFYTNNDNNSDINNPIIGYHFLEYYDGDSNNAYFMNTFKNNNIIEVFNYQTEEFTSISLPNDDNYSYNYLRNANGDVVVNKYSIKNINESQYYYISSPFK